MQRLKNLCSLHQKIAKYGNSNGNASAFISFSPSEDRGFFEESV